MLLLVKPSSFHADRILLGSRLLTSAASPTLLISRSLSTLPLQKRTWVKQLGKTASYNGLLTQKSSLIRYQSSAASKKPDTESASHPPPETSASGATSSKAPAEKSHEPEKKLTIWEKVKHEAHHYWDGTKLLGYEMKVSTKLVAKMAAGYELTRRENRQLQRTLQDISRLVPFAMFIIVPFAELLLPIALKIFPNLLPSTYESIKDKEAKTKKLRKTRDNVSTFLKKTLGESGMRFPDTITVEQKAQFAEFFKQINSSVETPSRELVVAVAQMFKDDLVLDNLSRPQLIAMARYMNMQAMGTNVIIRYQIRHRMRQIKRDDKAIDYEGVDSLTVPEVQSACASRGIKTYGVSPARLRDDIRTWLDLRLRQRVPSTLLVLASAFTYGEPESADSYYDAIRAVLSALPEELYHEAELEISSDAATHKQRLEVIKEQQELIKDENAQELESGHIIQVKDDLNLDEENQENKQAIPPSSAEKSAESDSTARENVAKTDKAAASSK